MNSRLINAHTTSTGLCIGIRHVPEQRPAHGESALVIQSALLARDLRSNRMRDTRPMDRQDKIVIAGCIAAVLALVVLAVM